LQQFISNNNNATEVQEEDKNKRVYCKWKATDILKAIKEGRNVIPGGYCELENTHAQLHQPQEDNTTTSNYNYRGTNSTPTLAASVPLDFEPTTGVETILTYQEQQEEEEELPNVNHHRNASAQQFSSIATTTDVPFSPTTKKSSSFLVETMSSFCVGPRSDSPDVITILPPPPTVPSSPTITLVPSTTTTSSKKKTNPISSFFSGSKKVDSESVVSKENLADALELTRFALKCLDDEDMDLAYARLEAALGCLGNRYVV
jgi:vacuolar protein sorting-associated protein VTA1